jgi:hypothetical protein
MMLLYYVHPTSWICIGKRWVERSFTVVVRMRAGCYSCLDWRRKKDPDHKVLHVLCYFEILCSYPGKFIQW